jgi:hemerythrin-like domain-containing protein
MQATARAREHQVVFCGLEVLRLIGERLENRNEVDRRDLDVVLTFMREVAHRCLDNTEDILRFAALDGSLANHMRARSVLSQLNSAVNDFTTEEFASLCQLYVNLLATAIFEDRRCLSTLGCDLTTLGQFYEWEREVDELARPHGELLHRLETKYTIPHCI